MNKNSDLIGDFAQQAYQGPTKPQAKAGPMENIVSRVETIVKAEEGIRDNLESLVVCLQGPINPVQDKSTGQISNMPMGLIGRLYAACEHQEKTQTEIITLLQKLKDLLS